MTKKIAVHPGLVQSIRDGDRHFVAAGMVAMLCGLHPEDYVIWGYNTQEYHGRRWEDYIHVFPRRDGAYPTRAQLLQAAKETKTEKKEVLCTQR